MYKTLLFLLLVACGGIQDGESSNMEFNDDDVAVGVNATADDSDTDVGTGMDEDTEPAETDSDPDTELDTEAPATTTTWYRDADTDGYGDPAVTFELLPGQTLAGYVDNGDDCDDTDVTRNVDCSVDTDTDTDSGSDADSETDTDSATDTDTESDTDTDSETDTEADTDMDTDSDSDTDSETDTDTATDVDTDTEADTDTDTDTDSGSDTDPGTDFDTDTDTEAPPETTTWYLDADGDGFGDAFDSVEEVDAPLNYVADDTDCDDDVATTHPGAEEICDLIDNNCDGEVNEGLEIENTWIDLDGDGYGSGEMLQHCFDLEALGIDDVTSSNGDDCDDADASVNPGVEEVCDDGFDNNCNALVDDEESSCEAPVAQPELCITGFDPFLTDVEVYVANVTAWDWLFWFVEDAEIIDMPIGDNDTICANLPVGWQADDVIKVNGYAWFGPRSSDMMWLVFGPTAAQSNITAYIQQGSVVIDCTAKTNGTPNGGDLVCN